MIRAVLDTNTIVSALIKKNGKPAQILAQHRRFQTILSEPILIEVIRVLYYPRIRRKYQFSEEEFIAYYSGLVSGSEIVTVEHVENIVSRDPTDDPVIATAKAGRARYIVSGDQDLTTLKECDDIRIVTPAQFLEILATQDEPNAPPSRTEPGAC